MLLNPSSAVAGEFQVEGPTGSKSWSKLRRVDFSFENKVLPTFTDH